MSEKKTLSIAQLSSKTGLSRASIVGILQAANIHVENDKETLTAEEQAKILDHIREKQQVKKKMTLKLSGDKLSLKPKTSSTQPQTAEHNPIVSLDKKFHKTTEHSQATASEPVPSSTQNQEKKTIKNKVQSKHPTTKPTETLTVAEVLAARTRSKTSDSANTAATSIPRKQQRKETLDPTNTTLQIPSIISVAKLAKLTGLKTIEIIKTFFDIGEMVTENQEISYQMAELVLLEHGFSVAMKQSTTKSSATTNTLRSTTKHAHSDIRPRPPVVTIMGHVDHGKTSLLDNIRSANHAAQEKGGITQHIGAWQVHTPHGDITFVDTPGHESFSAMRSRGARITDIVILVVAADDGVMPQTKEAIHHAQNAGVPIIVAINKVDKEDADIERVRTELSQQNILSEEWGGTVQFRQVSAKTGQGIPELLESISLQAEIMELTADYLGYARGVVVESRLDKGKGPVSTVIVQSGVFKKGSPIYCHGHYGKVRNMVDSHGKSLKEARPSQTFELVGLSGTTRPGDSVEVTASDKEAKALATENSIEQRQEEMQRKHALKTEYFLKKIVEANSDAPTTVLPLIIKADTDGSLEALSDFIQQENAKEKTAPFIMQLVGKGVGGINTSDVQLALASDSIILGFNVRADLGAKQLIQTENVKIQYFGIIYELIDYLQHVEQDMTEPESREEITGEARVKDVFRASKFGTIAGCVVSEGKIKKNGQARVLRDNTVIFSGHIESLRRFQDNVDEVKSGLECGIGIKAYSDIKIGDVIETFIIIPRERNDHGKTSKRAKNS